MQTNLTDITLLLDRTGSMASIASDVIGGVNTFIETQKKAEGRANFTLVQFDSQDPQEVVFDAVDIASVEGLKDYQPRAWTPLLDALGLCIVRTGERLAAIDESQRPAQVIFVVFTDGLENASKEYNKAQVRQMIDHQKNTYNWDFIFMGANIDTFAEAGSVGIDAATAADVDMDLFADALYTTAENVARYRTTGHKASLSYTREQRERMKSK